MPARFRQDRYVTRRFSLPADAGSLCVTSVNARTRAEADADARTMLRVGVTGQVVTITNRLTGEVVWSGRITRRGNKRVFAKVR